MGVRAVQAAMAGTEKAEGCDGESREEKGIGDLPPSV